MSKIKDINAREILDSRSHPTVEARVFLDNGICAFASVPSGASTGTHEAVELRDNDPTRFLGKGVLQAINNIEKKIKPELVGKEVSLQQEIDKIMIDLDCTENKSSLGANSILAVSLACCRASAKSQGRQLYQYIKEISANKKRIKQVTPLFNVINGGFHGTGALDFQEFFIIPDQSKPFEQALTIGAELYQLLKKYLKLNNLIYSVGDEGGFTPNLSSNYDALKLLQDVVQNSSYKYSQDIYLGLDLAATTFYSNGKYHLKEEKLNLSTDSFIDYLGNLNQEFNFFLLEDPLHEDDWVNWSKLSREIGNNTLIVGDDLLVTNLKRLKRAIQLHACNSIIIKVNQIGTLTETLKVIKCAQDAGFKIIISNRSGETNDDFIADLAVGVGADLVKFGAPARGERVAKYNRLLEIYQGLK